MSTPSRQRERVLAQVALEARDERVPEIDWSRVERRLADLPTPAEPQARAPMARVAIALAAAAAVLVSIAWPSTVPHHEPAVTTPPALAERTKNGDALAPGTRLTAEDGELEVEHAGRSRFTLAKGSIVILASSQGVVQVVLERGSLLAEVVPTERAESFVVEAASTRVAVHGTRFRVTLAGDGVRVNVSEGTVLVGPRAEPGTGTSLSAPANSHFTLGGEPFGAKPTEAPSAARPRSERVTSAEPAAPAPSAVEEEPALRDQPSTAATEDLVSKLVAVASSCFRRHTTAGDGVRVTAATQATLRALPNGKVELAGFDPPLAPPVHACVEAAASNFKLEESRSGLTLSRRIELER